MSQLIFPGRLPAKSAMAPPRRGAMESAWLWTVALGAGWLDTRTDPSPPSKFPQKASSASLYLEAAFFFTSIPSWGAHQPNSCLHFPSSHPGCLSLLSLDSECQMILPTHRTPVTKGDRPVGCMAGCRQISSFWALSEFNELKLTSIISTRLKILLSVCNWI